MLYLSVDIETTGLDRDLCQIIEFAAVIADTNGKLDSLPTFQRVIEISEGSVWEDYAWNLHKDWYPMILGRDKISEELLLVQLKQWLNSHGMATKKIYGAGKNFATFDREFIMRLPGYGSVVEFRHRVLDPAMLWFNPVTDSDIPDTAVCCERAGIISGKHRALQDALMTIKLLNLGWNK